VERLTAPSQSATAGVRLAGREVAGNGSWRPPLHTESVPTHSGILTLELAPASAALVTIGPRTAVPGGHRSMPRP
ncbi:MAG: glycosyl hydrolase family 79 C-terminal domain-containing protein, partial [Solirubrobacteraceae bacterium]